ncbi:MAG: hypothetical protein KTR31_24985 [Myxococcales bacterium]|nr:hypothetical protein [Myxococcales bacterium]
MTSAQHPGDAPVLLLDALSLLFRAFYGLPPMTTTAGVPTGGLYGMSSLLLKLLREQRPSGLAFALESRTPTFRHQAFQDYKAQRPTAPDPLRAQLQRLPELFDALGAPAHRVAGFEADDVLASLASQLSDRSTLVVTGDTDLFQVARGPVAVWYVGRRQADAQRMDAAAVRARYGIAPSQIPTFKALVGDPSDNLPGLPGVGKKTASRWITEHGSASAIVAAADTLTPTRLQPTVAAAADALVMYEDLATVRSDLELQPPLAAPFDDVARGRLDAWFEQLEFKSLRKRLADLPVP